MKTVTETELSDLEHMAQGERLKWIREQLQDLYKKGYSINQVAKNINIEVESIITAQGLSAIEMGKTKYPSARTINALADYYRIPSEVLFDEYYKNNPRPFTIGALAVASEAQYSINIIANARSEYSETVSLSPPQLENLIKRIKFEISLLKEEQN
ncbi:helix-turn-helix transcriptional regulator [Acinetobacter sp. CUI P1]|nr:helix-turn-helix transcriptional regulator [Acinetobacter sp. CUI P1]